MKLDHDIPAPISATPAVITADLKLSLLLLVLGSRLFTPSASAQIIMITDLTEDPISVTVTDSLNPADNRTYTADKATPEKVSLSFSVDGTGGGHSVAVLLEPDKKTVSDILEINVTQKTRGQGIKYLDITGTFTSDGDPKGLDLTTLGLTDAIMAKVLQMGLVEDGSAQDLGAQLIDTTTGDKLDISNLRILVASEVPEPSSVLVCSGLLASWVFFRRLRSN